MISGTFQPADLLAAQRVHLRPRRSLAIVGVILIALCIGSIWAMWFGPLKQTPGLVRWFIPIGLLYFPLFFLAWLPYRMRRSFKQRKDLQREATMSFSEAGFSFSNENSSGFKPWSDYLRWKEGKQVFLLYVSDNLFQVVPKRFFSVQPDVDQFRLMLSKQVSPRKT